MNFIKPFNKRCENCGNVIIDIINEMVQDKELLDMPIDQVIKKFTPEDEESSYNIPFCCNAKILMIQEDLRRFIKDCAYFEFNQNNVVEHNAQIGDQRLGILQNQAQSLSTQQKFDKKIKEQKSMRAQTQQAPSEQMPTVEEESKETKVKKVRKKKEPTEETKSEKPKKATKKATKKSTKQEPE